MKYPLVLLEWDDASAQGHGWSDTASVENAIVHSVGFLILKTRNHLIIAQDVDAEGNHNGRSQIPRGMVKSMKVLRKKD